eukprot:scaffold119520_cov26-Tisochrysis_lutea.AAC.2
MFKVVSGWPREGGSRHFWRAPPRSTEPRPSAETARVPVGSGWRSSREAQRQTRSLRSSCSTGGPPPTKTCYRQERDCKRALAYDREAGPRSSQETASALVIEPQRSSRASTYV